LEGFGEAAIDRLRAGETMVEPAAAAHLTVPLIKGGRLAAFLSVQDEAPRAWDPDDVALVQEVAERTWSAGDRARGERELQASEDRLRQLVEVGPQFVWVMDPGGRMEYVNRRWTEYSGLDLAASADRGALAGAIHEEDRDEMVRRLEEALTAARDFEM